MKNPGRALSWMLVAGVLTTAAAMAQSPSPAPPVPVISPASAIPQASPAVSLPEVPPSRLAVRLQKQLNVTPQLAAQLDAIIDAWFRKVSLPHVQEFRQKMSAIYTPEQAALLEKWRSERKTLGAKAPRHRVAELHLSKAQLAQIEAARDEADKTMRADRARLFAETRPLLSPAQAAKLDRAMRFHDREAWRGGRSPWLAPEPPAGGPVQSPLPTPDGTQGQ